MKFRNSIQLIGAIVSIPKFDNNTFEATLCTPEYTEGSGSVIIKTDHYHNMIAFGETAKKLNQETQKGSKIMILGKLLYDRSNNGIITTKIEVTDFITQPIDKSQEIKPREISINSDTWDFVEKHYPDYESSDTIAYNGDLSKLMDNQWDDGDAADVLRMTEYDGTSDPAKNINAQLDFLQSELSVYQEAIANYQSKTENLYFLFGEDACRAYEDQEEEEFLRNIKIIGHGTYSCNESSVDPIELLEALVGWNEYTTISSELYAKLSNL